jgi:predicted site-specific integrase-resolvase
MTELLTGRDVARRLNVSHVTIQRWIRNGKLVPTFRSTQGPLFDPAYIAEVAKNRVHAEVRA